MLRRKGQTREEYNLYFREYRKRRGESMRIYKREYNKAWRKKNGYRNEKKAKKKFPEKEYARRLLQIAVRKGRIIRGTCEVCGKSNGQGHHDDYMKPLDVRWFCPLHHIQYHKKLSPSPI